MCFNVSPPVAGGRNAGNKPLPAFCAPRRVHVLRFLHRVHAIGNSFAWRKETAQSSTFFWVSLGSGQFRDEARAHGRALDDVQEQALAKQGASP